MKTNKYYGVLADILNFGKHQTNKKGGITYLLNYTLTLTPDDLLAIFDDHRIAKKKLRAELALFMEGEENISRYNENGITWWDYCGNLHNSYPTYFKKLPALVDKINKEKRSSKNYVLFLGETGVETPQLPCLSAIQFQIEDDELVISAFQRSSDANLGLPSDIYQLYIISRMIELPLKSITIFFGNVHIYDNNVEPTELMLEGHEQPTFTLNT